MVRSCKSFLPRTGMIHLYGALQCNKDLGRTSGNLCACPCMRNEAVRPVNVNSYTQTVIVTDAPQKKASGRHNNAFVQARFPMSPCSNTQIDHLCVALCMKGKCMHVRERNQGREGAKKKWDRSYDPIGSLFTLLLLSPTSLAFSLPPHPPPFLSLSPQRNPVSPLGLELFEGDPELYCCCSLCSPPSMPLPPSPTPTLHPLLPPF